MPLNSDFCLDIMGCDQPRKAGCSICNITHEPLNGMNLWDCPEVKKVLADHRTIGRREAAAELDRAAGQPPKTYIEKQSLVNLLVLTGDTYFGQETAPAERGTLYLKSHEYSASSVIGGLLKGIISGGANLREVEL